MAATVTIAEFIGPTPGIETTSITNTNMGTYDGTNLTAATCPITAGGNSYTKWQKFRASAAGGSARIQNLKVWASASLASYATHLTNCRETYYGGASPYVKPNMAASTAAQALMATSTPASANVGIGGNQAGYIDLAGSLPAYSDYIVMQIQTTASATAGTTVTMNYQYDEVT